MYNLFETSRMLRAAYLEIIKDAYSRTTFNTLDDDQQDNDDEEATSEEETDDKCAQ